MEKDKSKQLQKNILYNLIIGNDGDLTNFNLPSFNLNFDIEKFSNFNELLKITNNDYIETEEIIGSIISEYLDFLINELINQEIVKVNL